jgi:hypothetical protein
MIMKKLFTLIAWTLLPVWAFSCTCHYFTGFCGAITPQSAVATVRIFNTATYQQAPRDLWIDVVVEETLQGIILHDTMTILASRSTTCDPDNSVFQIGDQFVIHLNDALIDSPTDWYSFYFRNGCIQDFLKILNGQVRLWQNQSTQTMSYNEFKNKLGDCARQTNHPNQATLESLLWLYPQPAVDQVWIDLQLPPFDYRLKLFSFTGQLLLEEAVPPRSRYPFDVSWLPNGIYFLHLQFGEASIVRKLVVQRGN